MRIACLMGFHEPDDGFLYPYHIRCKHCGRIIYVGP